MKRFLKILLILFISLVVLVGIALFVITQIIDPNQFKPEIEKQARQHANLTLNIEGDLAWQFWPSIGVSLGRTEARIEDDEELFAAFDQAAFSVRVWPLFSGRVEMDGIRLAGVNVDIVEDEDGANWERLLPDANAEDEEIVVDEESDTPLDIPLTIPSVVISDGQIRYRNLVDGTDIIVERFNLSAQDVSLNQPFPLQTSLRYQDQNHMRVDLAVNTIVDADINANRFRLKDLNVETTLAGVTPRPIDVRLEAQLDLDLEQGRVAVDDLLLRALGTQTRGNLVITDLFETLSLAGQINTAPFDLNNVLEAMGEAPIETTDPKALSRVGIAATLAGPAGSAMVNPLVVTLDDSTLRGRAGLESLETGKIVFDLNLNRITLDGYLPPDTATADSGDAVVGAGQEAGLSALSEEPLIPVEALRPLLVDGRLTIDRLRMDSLDARDIVIAVTAKDGVLRLREAKGKTLDGGFDITASLDVSGNTPRIRSTQKIDGVQIQPLVQLILGDDLALGLFSMSGTFSANGNSERALVESAQGRFELGLVDTVIRGVALYDSVVGGVNNLLGEHRGLVAGLIPGQDSGRLPAALTGDSRILDLTTLARLDKQVAYLDSLNADLQQGVLKGKGWMNTLTQEFDLQLTLRSQHLGSSEYLKNIDWPVRCRGNLAGNPATWCGPDMSGFRNIGQSLLSVIARDRTRQELRDRLGIDVEGDTAEEILRNAARLEAQRATTEQRERAQKEIDSQRQRLQEEQSRQEERLQEEGRRQRDRLRDELRSRL